MPVKREYIAEAFRVQSHDTRGRTSLALCGARWSSSALSRSGVCVRRRKQLPRVCGSRGHPRGASVPRSRHYACGKAGALNTITPECECVQEDF